MASNPTDSQLQASPVRIAELEQDNQQLRAEFTQLRQENDRLQKSEARYRQMFENAPISMLCISAQGKPIEMNSVAEEFLGWTIAQANAAGFNGLTDSTLAKNGTLASLNRAITGETVIEPPMYFDPSSTIGQGQWKWAQGYYYPVRDAAGQVQEVVEVALDLTEMYGVQQELAQERTRLLSATAQVANLLLRTPDYTTVLPDVVRLLGEAVGSDRCTVMQDIGLHPTLNQPALAVIAEWCKSGVPHALEVTPPLDQAFLWSDVPETYETLIQGQVFNRLVADIKEPGRSFLQAQGNTCCLFVPILVEGELWGLFSFDNCGEAQLYNEAEIAILQVAAESIAVAIERQAKDKKLQEAQEALIQTEQARSRELEKTNSELQQRDRLLSTVAEVTVDLLENPHVEEAITYALQRMGETAGISRVMLMQEKLEVSSGRPQHRVVNEWAAPNIPNQMYDPTLKAVYNDQYGVLIDELHAGRSIWHIIADFPEPARTQQIEIGVKSTGAVPIFLEERYFGCVAFEDCVAFHQWTTHEIDVLTSGAGAIGAALHRKQLFERLIEERTSAVQQRTIEMVKVNDVLRRSIAHLTTADNLQSFLTAVLLESLKASGAVTAATFAYDISAHTLRKTVLILHGEVIDIGTDPRAEIWRSPVPADITNAWQTLSQERKIVWIDNDSPPSELWPISRPWHDQFGHKTIAAIPLFAGEQALGFLGLCFDTHQKPSEFRLEQCWTLAQHAAMAFQMSQLAEETKQSAIFEERNRLAGEIHDTLAQTFTGISVQLELAQYLSQHQPTEVGSTLDRIGSLAQTGLSEARRSVWAIYPTSEDYTNLAQQLSDCVEQLTQGTPLHTQVNISGEPYPLTCFIGKNLFRIGQEAITNTLKHAQATEVRIELIYTPTQVSLSISDNGCGFCPQDQAAGFGLIGISERTDRMGGQLRITPQPGQGTKIFVEVPL